MKALNPGHYLMGCRLDNWIRLLRQNRFAIRREGIPQALLITATSLATAPLALAESAIFNRRIRSTPLAQDPVFIIGHWRSGTTYLQNIMSRDPQFGWADPVSTATMPICLLMGRAVAPSVRRGLKDARPMDNMHYGLDLPMEETFALLTVSDQSIIHMIAFPQEYRRYLAGAFVEDLPREERAAWERTYDFLLRKLTYICGGKQLLLKSPDNTAHMKELMGMYPDARFVNIHRDPYDTVRSTVHMFSKQMDQLRLSPLPEGDIQELIEDTVIYVFERMYRQLFSLMGAIPENRLVDIAYTDFVKDPVGSLEGIYRKLELDGFEAARGRFEAYAAGQKDYVKNRFDYSPRLIRKVNENLGFYFERYGYPRREEERT